MISLYFFVGESVRKEISAVTYSTFSYFFSAMILMVYSLLRKESLWGYTEQTWLAFIGLAMISTICGQFVFNLLLKHIPASVVTMGILGEPIGTCILAVLILNERIAHQQMMGILTIILGMIVFFFVPPRKNTHSAQKIS